MRKDFYIFRHGETDYNAVKRWQGCGIDSDLNANGIAQAHALAQKLKDLQIEIIYSSCLKRAVQTTEIVADCLGVSFCQIPELREANLGQTEGLPKSEVAEAFPKIFAEWYAPENNLDVRFPDGESKREIQQRMYSVLERLLTTEHSVIGIASHGSSIRYLLMYFGFELGRMPNTALFHLVYEDGSWFVQTD